MNTKILLLPLVVASTILVGGCIPQKNEPLPDTTPIPATQLEVIEETSEADYTLELGNFYFAPNKMEAKPGQTLTVKLNNANGFHNLVIDELGVKSQTINTDDETVVEIKIPADVEPGTEYEFYCSIGNHRQQGMFGTLSIVVGD